MSDKRFIKHIFICLLSVIVLSATAAETRLIGQVVSGTTGEPMPNVSVYFKGSQVGTTTDEHGTFYLHVDLMRTAQLTISSIGYKTQKITVEPGQDAGLSIVMEEKRHKLDEVVVLPGENPALALMDSVRAHRRQNQELAESGTDGDSETQYFLSHITGKTLKRRLWKSLESGMIRQEDSTYILPLPDELYASLAVPIPEHMDFYNPTLPFGGLSLLSPTAASAPAYYYYFLIDSLEAPKRYIVDFKPKNAFDPLFTGSLTIDSATYALTDVKAAIPKEANINYLTALQYRGEYGEQRVLQEENMTAVMDLAVKMDSSHIFPALMAKQRWHGSTELRNHGTTEQRNNGAMSNSPSLRESVNPSLRDSTPEPPLIKVLSWLAWIYHTGYIKTGTPIDIGNIIEVLQYNRYETLHFGLPFRTNEKLFRHVSLEAYVGYGLRDRAVKYKTQMQVILPTERRNILGVYWWDHYAYSDVSAFDELLCENNWGYGNMPFTTYVLSDVWYGAKSKEQRTMKNTAVRKREFKLWAENDWCSSQGARPAVETKLSVQLGRMGYGDACQYHYYDMPSFRYRSVSGTVRLGWREKTADLYLTRKHIYSTLPTLFIGAEMGSWQMDNEAHYHMYGHLDLLVRQNVSLGMGGTLNYSFGAGLVLGTVPYPLLAIMDGNQSYSYAQTRFTLMNNAQFMTDKYLILHADWNGQGILFNRIPGVRYLRLRELLEMKVAYGGLGQNQVKLNSTLEGAPMETLNVPYVEVGVGIGNILRIGDVYSIWRLTHVGDATTPRWAIRFRLNLGL